MQKGKTGEPTVPREDQKLHYKRKGWVAKRRQRKQREKEEIFQKRKQSVRICSEEKEKR